MARRRRGRGVVRGIRRRDEDEDGRRRERGEDARRRDGAMTNTRRDEDARRRDGARRGPAQGGRGAGSSNPSILIRRMGDFMSALWVDYYFMSRNDPADEVDPPRHGGVGGRSGYYTSRVGQAARGSRETGSSSSRGPIHLHQSRREIHSVENTSSSSSSSESSGREDSSRPRHIGAQARRSSSSGAYWRARAEAYARRAEVDQNVDQEVCRPREREGSYPEARSAGYRISRKSLFAVDDKIVCPHGAASFHPECLLLAWRKRGLRGAKDRCPLCRAGPRPEDRSDTGEGDLLAQLSTASAESRSLATILVQLSEVPAERPQSIPPPTAMPVIERSSTDHAARDDQASYVADEESFSPRDRTLPVDTTWSSDPIRITAPAPMISPRRTISPLAPTSPRVVDEAAPYANSLFCPSILSCPSFST